MNGVCDRSSGAQYDPGMRPRPQRLERLPQQYFVALLGRVAAAAAAGRRAARRPRARQPGDRAAAARRRGAARGGARPGRPRLRADPRPAADEGGDRGAATATSTASSSTPRPRSRSFPGTKTAIVELALSLCDEGDTLLLPDPYYPDYPSGPALAGARLETVPLRPERRLGARPRRRARRGRALSQLPVEPVRRLRARRRLRGRRRAGRTGRAAPSSTTPRTSTSSSTAGGPQSFLATPGAKDVGVEMWSMSKTYGMAGWRIGFVVGNAEIVERINLLNDHSRVGIFAPLQAAAIAALEGPQDSVAERVDAYERRRDAIAAALPGAARLRGHVLRLAASCPTGSPPSAARRAPRRGRAGRGLRPERRRLGAPLARRRRRARSSSAPSACSARSRRSRGRRIEDRHRGPVLVVVLGRRRRARRAPGRRAAAPRARRADHDGQRPARTADAPAASAHRPARRRCRTGSSRSAARSSCRRTARCRTSSSRREHRPHAARPRRGAVRRRCTCTSR